MSADLDTLALAKVGAKVAFAEEKRPYTVRARSDRFLVCTKPFAARKTVIYTVVDLVEGVRGTENLVIGFGAETDEQCSEMVDRLEGRTKPDPEGDAACRSVGVEPVQPIRTEVSRRNRIALRVRAVLP